MADALDMSDVVVQLSGSLMRQLRTAVVVRIDSYDASEGSATVTPMVLEERILNDERVEIPSSSIPGCPVIFPYGGGRGLTFGLEAGDLAIGLYRHRSHDEVDGGADGPLLPASTRRVDLSDLVVLPGFFPPSGGYPSSGIRSDGQPVMPLPSGEAIHVGDSNATFALVRWDLLESYLDAIKAKYDAHVHGYVLSGAPTPTTPPVVAPLVVVPDPFPPVGDYSSDAFKVDR